MMWRRRRCCGFGARPPAGGRADLQLPGDLVGACVVQAKAFGLHLLYGLQGLLPVELLALASRLLGAGAHPDHRAFLALRQSPALHQDIKHLVPRQVLDAQAGCAGNAVRDDDVKATEMRQQLKQSTYLDRLKIKGHRLPLISLGG